MSITISQQLEKNKKQNTKNVLVAIVCYVMTFAANVNFLFPSEQQNNKKQTLFPIHQKKKPIKKPKKKQKKQQILKPKQNIK